MSSPDLKEILFIEKLDFFVFLFLIKNFRCYKKIYYVEITGFSEYLLGIIERYFHVTIGICKAKYSDFPGSYFDAHDEATLYVNDALFKRNPDNVFVNLALVFCGSPDYHIAIRSEVYRRYTENRIKNFIFMKYLSKEYDDIVFLPSSPDDISAGLSQENCLDGAFKVPRVISWKNTIVFQILNCISVLAIIPLSFYIATIIALRGICVHIAPKKFRFGYDVYSSGIPWDRPYAYFCIFDNESFSPKKILNVMRGPLGDLRTRQFFQKYHYPYTEFSRQKVSIRYFFSRVVVNFLLRNMVYGFIHAPFSNRNSRFMIPSFAVMKMTMDTEIFYQHFDVKVFIFRDDFNPLHIIRTLVSHTFGNRTIGYAIGDYSIRNIPYIMSDRYGMWGEFYPHFHAKSLKIRKIDYIGAGIHGLDKTYEMMQRDFIPNKYRELRKKYRVVIISGTSYDESMYSTKELQYQFYKSVLDATDQYPDVYRIINPKQNELNTPEFQDLFKKYERIAIDNDLWSYKLILICDLLVIFATSSLGMEAITAGKKVIYYDLTGWRNHIYSRYSPYLVVFSEDQMKKAVDYVLHEHKYVDDAIMSQVRKEHGYRFDGHVLDRFRNNCLELLEETNEQSIQRFP